MYQAPPWWFQANASALEAWDLFWAWAHSLWWLHSVMPNACTWRSEMVSNCIRKQNNLQLARWCPHILLRHFLCPQAADNYHPRPGHRHHSLQMYLDVQHCWWELLVDSWHAYYTNIDFIGAQVWRALLRELLHMSSLFVVGFGTVSWWNVPLLVSTFVIIRVGIWSMDFQAACSWKVLLKRLYMFCFDTFCIG